MAISLAAHMTLLAFAVVTLTVGALHNAGSAPAMSTSITSVSSVTTALEHLISIIGVCTISETDLSSECRVQRRY